MKTSEFIWADVWPDEEITASASTNLFLIKDNIDKALKEVTGYSIEDLQVKNRNGYLNEARQIGMAFYHFAGCTLVDSGMRFHRDHATVVHAVNKIRTFYGMGGEKRLTGLIDNMMKLTELNIY